MKKKRVRCLLAQITSGFSWHNTAGWRVVETPADLVRYVTIIQPRYVFFLHWRWKVPTEILQLTECVGFHMTALPWGRGGSPLQNLIHMGQRKTTLTAYQMTSKIDAGPIYLQASLDLSGSARDIYGRANERAMQMAQQIVEHNAFPPTPQRALRKTDVVFKRRQPHESVLPGKATPKQLYDHIRMLDADGYPHAFADAGPWRITFTDAECDGREVTARATFHRIRSRYVP